MGTQLSSWSVNDLRGAERVVLTVGQIPIHTHKISTEFAAYDTHVSNFTRAPTAGISYPSRLMAPTDATTANTYAAYAKAATAKPDTYLAEAALSEALGVEANGGHENRQPVLAMRFAINAIDGFYPPFD